MHRDEEVSAGRVPEVRIDARDEPASADHDAFEEVETVNDAAQDRDDEDPNAPARPPFEEPARPAEEQEDERRRERQGNRGPEEMPGFGQGA